MKIDRLTCAAGNTPATIGALHDRALDAAESVRIRTHMATCSACQTWLAEHQHIDSALCSQRVPQLNTRPWAELRTARTRNARLQPATTSASRVVGGVGALAAVLLVALGFAQVLQSRGTQRHTTSLATATPAGKVATLAPITPSTPVGAAQQQSWSTVPVPVSFTGVDAESIALSPTDGNTAYLCYGHNVYAQAQAQIWVTHNRGANWKQLATLPDGGKVDFAECDVWVDAVNPSIVGAAVSAQSTTTLASFVHLYVSADDGSQWKLVPNTVLLGGMATINGETYALREAGSTYSTQPGQIHLSVSTDGMMTWRSIDASFTAQNLRVEQFWVRPGDSELLAVVNPPPIATSGGTILWESSDGGTHWTRLSAPTMQDFSVGQPAADQTWQICGYNSDLQNGQVQNEIECTISGGQSWTARPALRLLYACTPSSICQHGVNVQSMLNLSIAGDGALLSIGPYGPTKDGVIQQIQGIALYRLPAGSTQWEFVGPIPSNQLFYVAHPGSGVLWVYGGGASLDTLGGPLGHTSYGTDIYAADYQP
jgi:hypothetical protein